MSHASTSTPVGILTSIVGAWLLATSLAAQETGRDVLAHGREVFARHCAACHGPMGAGDGVAAPHLSPPPRDFGRAAFKIVSTVNGVPSHDDLVRTIERGLPGAAMPGHAHLPPADVVAVAHAVRALAIEGRTRSLRVDLGLDPDLAAQIARNDLAPGAPLQLGPEPPRTIEAIARGERVFEEYCVRCHDLDGRAQSRLDLADTSGHPVTARNFRRGVFKGGSDSLQLARRVVLGMPGGPMPAMRLPEEDVWAVVHYLQSMVEPGADEAAAQRREAIVARRVSGRLDDHLHLDDWAQATVTHVPLMPMHWRRSFPATLEVSALHDGQRLALRLRWDDDSRDAVPGLDDGVAIQFSPDLDPPFFGMGERRSPVSLIQWRAEWEDTRGRDAPVLSPASPDLVEGDLAPAQGSAAGTPPVDHPGAVQEDVSTGPGQLHPALHPGLTSAPDSRARGLRDDAGWDVIVYRDLQGDDDEVSLAPGGLGSVAFAVWDASAGDRGPRKCLSIWQVLVLE